MWMSDTVAAFNMSKAICKLGLEGIVSKKLDAPYKSGPSKAWLKIKNPKAPAATRAAASPVCGALLPELLRGFQRRQRVGRIAPEIKFDSVPQPPGSMVCINRRRD
jgi:hypothetical protein